MVMNVLLRLFAAALLLCLAGTVWAQNPQPYCADSFDTGCPGTNQRFEGYLPDEDELCYRVELTCNRGVFGGMGISLASDGGVGGGYWFGVSGERWCDAGFAHLLNDNFEHGCDFRNGRFALLEVKRVKMKFCRDETADGCPAPPPPP